VSERARTEREEVRSRTCSSLLHLLYLMYSTCPQLITNIYKVGKSELDLKIQRIDLHYGYAASLTGRKFICILSLFILNCGPDLI
jgi:hypothetical protein